MTLAVPDSQHLGEKILYLSEQDVVSVGIEMSDIIASVESALCERGAGRVEMPPKIGVHTMPDAFLHAMPASIPSQRAVGIKWVGGYPDNYKRDLPYISGLLILNEHATGFPLAVMDCTWITAVRTAAATAIAAKYLARPDSSTIGILGCGVQGRSNLEALCEVFQVKKVLAYDTRTATSVRYAREMQESLSIEVVPVTEPKDAVIASDIIITAGPILHKPHATIQPGWFPEGAFASLVDFDSYWHPDALRQAEKFCTDDIPQLHYYRTLGYLQDIPPVYAELSELVTARKPGRESQSERTVACNLGLALEDIAVAPRIYSKACEKGIGTWLDL